MPIAPYRHEEGPEWYIVQTANKAWSGKRLGVAFVEGEGWTDDREKAREFAETYGYTVILGIGAEAIQLAAAPEEKVVRGRPMKNESAVPKMRSDRRKSRAEAEEGAEAEEELEPVTA